MIARQQLQAISMATQWGDFPLAERLCRAALLEEPQREELLFFLAVSLQYQSKTDAAIDTYRRLTQIFPSSAVHWGNFGTALREAGRLDEADEAYAEAIRLDGGKANPHINAGLLLIQKRDFLGAREKMLDAIDKEPELPMARVHAAIACALCQDFDRAEHLLKPWRQWLPLADDALQIELSNQLLLLGQGDAAQIVVEELLQRKPHYAEARLRLATIYERMNRVPEAEEILRSLTADGARTDMPMLRAIDHALASVAVRKGQFA